MVGIGMAGSGFIADSYARALADAGGARVVANVSREAARREEFARRHGSTGYADLDGLCADPAVDLVLVALPNAAHLPAVAAATRAGKAVACTKPLGRTGAEAREALDLVTRAGVWHGYAENAVYAPAVTSATAMLRAGGIGDLLALRAVEGHPGPHADHFWDTASTGGGALLDMGSHIIALARHLFGKDNPVVEVLAWGATHVHGGRTSAEDVAVALLRFAGGQLTTAEASWIDAGGLQLRHELVGSRGRLVADLTSSPVDGFLTGPAGYVAEKAGAETGWVRPVPDEERAYGITPMLRHFVERFAAGELPTETFADGVAVNDVVDAAYRSMRTRTWEPVPVE